MHRTGNCTADPASVVEAYEMVKEAGAAFLDAPFTGSKVAAGKGALVYYIGGDGQALEKVRPVLETSAKEPSASAMFERATRRMGLEFTGAFAAPYSSLSRSSSCSGSSREPCSRSGCPHGSP